MNFINPKLYLQTALLLLFFSVNIISIQAKEKDPPPMIYGEPKVEEFNFSIADYQEFNPESPIVILCDYAQQFQGQFGNTYQTRTVVERRLMIMNDEGVKQSVINISFQEELRSHKDDKYQIGDKYGRFWTSGKGQGIFKIKATLFHKEDDGSITKTELDKHSIFYTDEYKDNTGINWSNISFTLPNVKPGDIIDYTYTKVSEYFLSSRYWFFQHEYPVVLSEFRIAYDETDSYALLYKGQFKEIPKPVESDITSKQYIKYKHKISKLRVERLPALKKQAFVFNLDNYRAGVLLQLSRYWNNRRGEFVEYISTWEKLAKKYTKKPEYGRQLFKYDAVFKRIRESIGNVTETEEIIKKCYTYVQNNLSWNGSYEREPSNNLDDVLDRGYGSSAEINMLLIRLLREFGLNAMPAFASTRSYGNVNINYPFILQFNTTICYLNINDKEYILDATSKYKPFNLLSTRLLGTNAFVVDMANPKTIEINSTPFSYENITTICKLNDGKLEIDTKIKVNNYFASSLRYRYGVDSLHFIEQYYENEGGFKISEIKTSGAENLEKFFAFSFRAEKEDAVNDYDSLIVFEPFTFFKSEVENVLHETSRSYPVEFSFPYKKTFRINFSLPEGYELVNLPKGKMLKLDDNSVVLKTIYQYKNNFLQMVLILQSGTTKIYPEDYAELRNIFMEWEDTCSPSIMLRKL